jgi:hypothetical protein
MPPVKRFIGLASVMLLACGDVVKNNPDADGGDDIDADGTDADDINPDGSDADDMMPTDGVPGESIVVHVLNRAGDGAPDLNAHVIVHLADGTAIADGAVDTNGNYTATVPSGGVVVTVVRTTLDTPQQLTSDLTSITDVQAGEEITVGLARRVAVQEGGTTAMTASYTESMGATGTNFYTACLVNGRAGTSGTVTLEFKDGCHGANFQLLGVSVGLVLPRFVALNDVPYTASGNFGAGAVTQTMSQFTATHSNVPPNVSRLATHRRTIVDGTAVATFSDAATDPAPGTVMISVPYPSASFLRAEVVATLSSTASETFMQHEVRTPSVQSGLAVDWTELALPWIDTVTASKTGLAWQTTIAGGSGDVMATSWRGSWNPGRPVTVTWRYIGTQTSNALTLPRLPPEFAELDPQAFAGTTMNPLGSASVTFIDYEDISSYAEIRAHAENYVGTMMDAETMFGGVGFTRRNASRGDR